MKNKQEYEKTTGMRNKQEFQEGGRNTPGGILAYSSFL